MFDCLSMYMISGDLIEIFFQQQVILSDVRIMAREAILCFVMYRLVSYIAFRMALNTDAVGFSAKHIPVRTRVRVVAECAFSLCDWSVYP